jgi:hypothetical protein
MERNSNCPFILSFILSKGNCQFLEYLYTRMHLLIKYTYISIHRTIWFFITFFFFTITKKCLISYYGNTLQFVE